MRRWGGTAVVLADAAATATSYLVAFRLRFFFGHLPLYNWLPFLRVLPGLVLLTLVVHGVFGLYGRAADAEEAQAEAIVASVVAVAAAMALSFLVGAFAVPRSVLLLAGVLQAGTLVAGLRRLGRREPPPALTLAEFAALADDELTRRLTGESALVAPDVRTLLLTNARLVRGERERFRLALPGLAPAEGGAVKRLFDLGVLLVVAPLALPLMGLLALMVLMGSGPPVLFGQERVGRDGRIFRMWKFRTLRPGSEGKVTLVDARDPRVTPVGRLLRLTRLDELPQLWNIARGEMSFVGPRPERPELVARFLAEVPGYRLRLAARPGLTGLAQLYGSYDLDVEEKLKYDVYYLLHASLALDVLLLLRTLAVPLQPHKARSGRRATGFGAPSAEEEARLRR